MKKWHKWIIYILLVLSLLAGGVFFLAMKPVPNQIIYGMSFNTLYADELGLDWREVYDAIIDDLGVRHLRLAAHWPMVEPSPGVYNFTELDYQIARAEEVGADVVFAVGRRLPRWPDAMCQSGELVSHGKIKRWRYVNILRSLWSVIRLAHLLFIGR